MRHRVNYFVLAATAGLGFLLLLDGPACRSGRALVAQPVATQQPPAKEAAQKPDDPGKKAVLANVRTFVDAFNRRDVKTLLTLFADDCVLTEDDGTTVRGLKELEQELKETFENEPDARLSAEVDSLQMVAPDVIIEEGKTTYFPDGKTLTAETDYQATGG